MAMELLLNAERKCCKLCTSTIQFNPALSKLGLHWRFWWKVMYFWQRRFYDEEYIDITAVSLEIFDHYDISLEKCIARLKLAKKEYLEAKKNYQLL